jgi:hypothetical protein
VTAGKELVAISKGEWWSVGLANVNRVYLRGAAHGKYIRSRGINDGAQSTQPISSNLQHESPADL